MITVWLNINKYCLYKTATIMSSGTQNIYGTKIYKTIQVKRIESKLFHCSGERLKYLILRFDDYSI